MAKKSLILDNGDGRVAFSNTSSVSIDDGAGSNMSASYMTASSLSLSGIGVGQTKLLSASNGTFSTFPDGTVNGGAIAFNGTSWVTSSLLVQDYSGSAYGDLSGSYESGVQVKNISNVSSGTLPVSFGGTGNALSASQAYILKVSSSAGGTPVISALSASSGSIVTTYGGAWTSIPPGYPDVRFYTSGSTGNTFTWNKPAGARFARVILQGAGGGGGGGAAATYNGAGGGSGGFTDITLDVFNTSSVAVTASLGGNGGSVGASGTAGGATIFGSYTAGGGGGGGVGANSAANYGTGGAGLTKNGGYGAASVTTVGQTVYSTPSGGAAGSNSPAKGSIVAILNNKNFGYHVTSDGQDLSTSLIDASGSNGGSGGVIPSRPNYGAGGGGGQIGFAGGPGGHGYALIISW